MNDKDWIGSPINQSSFEQLGVEILQVIGASGGTYTRTPYMPYTDVSHHLLMNSNNPDTEMKASKFSTEKRVMKSDQC